MKPSRTLLALLALYGTAQAAQITLFKQPNFTGEAMTLHTDNTDLAGASFQDQVSSIVVQSGRWQVCTQPNFQGNCSVLEPGRYASLDQSLNHRIESARQVDAYARNGSQRYGYAERDSRDRGYNGYEGYNGNNGYDERPYRDPRGPGESSRDYRSPEGSYPDRDYRYGR